ncbi:MAG: hypothetical protein LBB45_07850 [Methanobrevibacter sp.]|jgi:hypothetical protein|nr:hypothetical protein [Candidatus Methanovirga basalitermitum]
MKNKGINTKNSKKVVSKLETCYLCNQEFDINKDDGSHYHYGKYPICVKCSEAYGFFNK